MNDSHFSGYQIIFKVLVQHTEGFLNNIIHNINWQSLQNSKFSILQSFTNEGEFLR